MEVLRPTLTRSLRRCYATQSAFIPSARNTPINPLPDRPKPSLPTFFTGKPLYGSAVSELESAIHENQELLRGKHIFPLPQSLSLQADKGGWDRGDMVRWETQFGTKLERGQFKRLGELLNELTLLRRIAQRTNQGEMVLNISSLIGKYSEQRTPQPKSTKDKKAPIDEFGRSVTTGRRKESSAKVWLIKTKRPENFQDRIVSSFNKQLDQNIDDYPELPTTQILINHLPIDQHFPRASDRELITRPLRLTGTFGYFNVFALTSGGGTTGQTGAVALALARGIATFLPGTAEVLRRDGLLTRDPRMVERKKTGLAKARKRVSTDDALVWLELMNFGLQYTWVKR